MRPHRLRVVAAAVALFAAPRAVGAAEADDIRAELEQISTSLVEAERDYLAPEQFEGEHKLTARLSDGQLFFLQRDYTRAAMVLLDVVEDPRNRAHPAYRDALTYLAESLYQIGNFNLAAQWFEEVVSRGTPDQQQSAMGRLLEIALQTGDVRRAQAYLDRASRLLASSPDPRLLYAVGKYHSLTRADDKALAHFRQVPADAELALRARYFEGVILLRKGRNDEALKLFEAIVATPPDRANAARDDAELIDLARLATSRIYYELGRFNDAVQAYAAISRESAHFDEALYESVWISIKQTEYEKALRKLEILLISQPDVVRGPDTRLLQGQLLTMLERYDDASLAFQEVLFEFGPIQTEMRGISANAGGDLATHFHRVIGASVADFDLASFLPERAAEFAGADVEADRALGLVRDLAAEKRSLEDARRTIERLRVAVNAPNRVEIFPRLREAWLRGTEARLRLTAVRGRMNDLAGRDVRSPEYAALRDERRRAAAQFERIPRSAVALQARDAKIDDEMIRLDQEAYKLGLQIGGMEAQLVAVDKYVADLGTAESDPSATGTVRAQVERELAEARALREQLQVLQRSIEEARIQVGANDEAASEDERVRGRLESALDAEEAWLARNAGVNDTERLRLRELGQRSAAVLQRTQGIVDDRIADIKKRIDAEQANVATYDGELVAYQGETESLGGAIAARSFEHVQKRVDDVVLEADVGLIDVAWKQKEDRSARIADLLARKRAELEALQRSFSEVSGD